MLTTGCYFIILSSTLLNNSKSGCVSQLTSAPPTPPPAARPLTFSGFSAPGGAACSCFPSPSSQPGLQSPSDLHPLSWARAREALDCKPRDSKEGKHTAGQGAQVGCNLVPTRIGHLAGWLMVKDGGEGTASELAVL